MSGTAAHRNMLVEYVDDLRLWRSPGRRVGLAAGVLVVLTAPFVLSEYQLNVLGYAGAAVVGALGLNLLTGYTGQVSLGHAAFIGAGAYAAGWFGASWGWPFVIYLPAAALVGFLIGAVVGPFALRLRGNYLVLVTLALLFVAEHIFANWTSVTGGTNGRSTAAATVKIGPLDFRDLSLFGVDFTTNQGMFWLIWGIAILSGVLIKNIVRTRPGRALQAVRDRDISAEIIGVDVARYKVLAFAFSGAFGAVSGVLYGSLQQFISPSDFNIVVSIQYVVMIIVGGLGTVMGSFIGGLLVGPIRQVLAEIGRNNDLPFVSGDAGGADGFIAVANLNAILFGVLIVAFLAFEPRGLAAVWFRVKAYFKTWPFSY